MGTSLHKATQHEFSETAKFFELHGRRGKWNNLVECSSKLTIVQHQPCQQT